MSRAAAPVLVVGTGFAGAVHARVLAETGVDVVVIDSRPHVAGNAYDEVDAEGVRVHRYGPHLFHSANRGVLAWIARYGSWIPYRHRVRARLPDGRLVPIPITVETVNAVFGTRHDGVAAAQAHLDRVALPILSPGNAAESLAATIGTELRDLLFRPYSRKMWHRDLEEMSAATVARLPLKVQAEDGYFSTRESQLLPERGYTAFIAGVLDHPRIRVHLSTAFDKVMIKETAHCFASMPIDTYFDECFGPLPYRSLRFHHRHAALPDENPWRSDDGFSVVNSTDDGPYTRETCWNRLPGHCRSGATRLALTLEEPCDDVENGMERYYPIDTSDGDNARRYRAYADLASKDPNVTFIGRCGLYRYLDMDQVISQSLASATRWLSTGMSMEN